MDNIIEKNADISYILDDQKFNYRVCAVITSDQKILAMQDELSPYYYLPGGRVRLGETAEDAIIREIEEELNIRSEIIRPLWLVQGFFNEDVDRLDYHEICIYYLMDISGSDIFDKGDRFTLHEKDHTHVFEWIPFDRLKDEYFYPVFLKKDIYDLPDNFTIRTEYE
ncbi:MAG: NUDIX domain-containing protein [Erysipelotrichaceae bacterium]|nr:NUDIX domain-containing protein [Erysipelotrichaceae bacterium]